MSAIEAAERTLNYENEDANGRWASIIADLASRETQRKRRVTAHFAHLCESLGAIRFLQRQTLEKSHKRDDLAIREMEESRDAAIARRERDIFSATTERVHADNETTCRNLKQKHATAMMETIARHRRDQDELLSSPSAAAEASSRLSMVSTSTSTPVGAQLASTEMTDNLLKATIIENLLPAQEAERTVLKSQQARELAKWRSRGETALQAASSEAKTSVLRVRLEEAEKVDVCARRLRQRIQAEWKWFEVLWEDRACILRDQEASIFRSGGDVPDQSRTHQRLTPPMPVEQFRDQHPPQPPSKTDDNRQAHHSLLKLQTPSHSPSSPSSTISPSYPTLPFPNPQHQVYPHPYSTSHLQLQTQSQTTLDVLYPFPFPLRRSSSIDRERERDATTAAESGYEHEDPHPGQRVYYGPRDSWMEREEKRVEGLREKRGLAVR